VSDRVRPQLLLCGARSAGATVRVADVHAQVLPETHIRGPLGMHPLAAQIASPSEPTPRLSTPRLPVFVV
jgi:hypothetical protein